MLTSPQASIIQAKTFYKLRTERDISFIHLRSKAKQLILDFAKDLKVSISDDELSVLSWAAVENLKLSPDVGVSVKSVRIKDDHWLDDSEVVFNCFDRFEKYLKLRKHWMNTDSLSHDSYSIIQMLGSPKDKEGNHRRGLLIGDVQSGKTASYTAIMNRAVDVGYNVIVLLAGSLENLRRQTQERIDNELVGFTLDPEDNNFNKIVGVGEFKIPSFSLNVPTTAKWDFTSRIRKKTGARIQDSTLLFVTKKNVTTLTQIYESLIEDNSNLRKDDGKIDASILVIDDEADNASVNTKKNPELNPTKINGAIRKILKIFRKTSYLAVTATPFANIYIDDSTDNEMFGDDLFPSDFIHLLSRPHAYTGAFKLFGDYVPEPDDPIKFESCLIPIENSSIPENSYRFGHKKDNVVVGKFEDFPAGLQQSIRYFLLVQYLMDFLPNIEKPHRTMMINISRFVEIQNSFVQAIRLWMDESLLPQIYRFQNYPDTALTETSGELFKLRKVWDKYNLNLISGKSWNEICPGLHDSFKKVRVCAENMSKTAKAIGRLNYNQHPEGDRVIAVGGQCLSRGLTLENLVVTYFYRNSVAYDTLLQMGRWFGYRDPYIQYFKIWMAEEAILWYRLISEACEDLRSQIDDMNVLGMEPRQFGLMVRRHPYSGLIITARTKMRKAQQGKRWPVDLKGRLIESPRLWKGDEYNKSNKLLIDAFLACFSAFSFDRNKNILLAEVPKADIYPVIASFDSAQLSIGFKVSQLGDYILKQLDQNWDVIIPCNGDGPSFELAIGGTKIPVNTIKRTFKYEGSEENGKPFIRVYGHHVKIGQGNITKMGLSVNQLSELERRYKSEKHDKSWDEVKTSYSVYLQARKENSQDYRNPLLILYPLKLENENKDEAKVNEFKAPVTWGMGIGFPGIAGNKEDQCYEYWLNPVAVRQGIGIYDDVEEEDDEDEALTE